MEKATFGMGCFWGPEVTFGKVDGVVETAVGYMGGDVDDPDYRTVCTGRTGHVEVVQVTYDPAKVSYQQLLEIFWRSHDPTQVNRQGPDFGTQYRTVIFAHDEEQRERAETSRRVLDESGAFPKPVATSIEPAQTFWRAEDYHQKYLEKRGLAVCHV
ncbi:MAG: peptide-methionine (S)-S-oxide reductase MsrA [Rhodospirillales bacterium]